ncbi:MAG: hypothetical protein ABSH33_19255 [Steroidobacteraceae bacterium]|jgi:hypothetical protein
MTALRHDLMRSSGHNGTAAGFGTGLGLGAAGVEVSVIGALSGDRVFAGAGIDVSGTAPLTGNGGLHGGGSGNGGWGTAGWGGHGASGGVGVDLASGTVTGPTTLAGGGGGNADTRGAGVHLSAPTPIPDGSDTGGASVSAISAVAVTGGHNITAVALGTGAGGTPGAAGVDFTSGTVIDTGTIGGGGAGVDLASGAVTDIRAITGGTGAAGWAGGHGGAGVYLGGGTLTTAGALSGGALALGGTGLVLELSGGQSVTPMILDTPITNFTSPPVASGARGTVHAAQAVAAAHTLIIDGVALGDTLDSTNLTRSGTTFSFSSSPKLLSIDHGATPSGLQFGTAFMGEQVGLTAHSKGIDVALPKGADAILAGAAHDAMDFVSDYHRALTDDRFIPGAHGAGLTLLASPATQDFRAFGIASHTLIEHGAAHTAMGTCKA